MGLELNSGKIVGMAKLGGAGALKAAVPLGGWRSLALITLSCSRGTHQCETEDGQLSLAARDAPAARRTGQTKGIR